MKYIQSFYQYPVTFSSIEKTIPARAAQGDLRNIAEITEAQLEILEHSEPMFRELIRAKKYRVLNHLPESYRSSAVRINEAQDEIARLKEKLRAQQAQLTANNAAGATDTQATETQEANDDLDNMSYKELQDFAKEKGLEFKNVKKSDLIEKLRAAAE